MIESIMSINWAEIWAAITTITTAIATLVAAVKNKAANLETARADTAEKKVEQTQAFFDPDNNTDSAMIPAEGTPDRSWKMSDSTRDFILSMMPTDADRVSILKQIQSAENSGLVDYTLTYSNDGYYCISYGAIISGHQPAKTTTATVETSAAATVPMSEAVLSFLVNGHPEAEQKALEAQIRANEAAGIFEYDLQTSRFLFHIRNGQITSCSANYTK